MKENQIEERRLWVADFESLMLASTWIIIGSDIIIILIIIIIVMIIIIIIIIIALKLF